MAVDSFRLYWLLLVLCVGLPAALCQEITRTPPCPTGDPTLNACNCLPNPQLGDLCLNGGICMSSSLLTFSCLCGTGISGARCQGAFACTSNADCTGTLLGSSCITNNGLGSCSCPDGFTALLPQAGNIAACIPLADECATAVPCQNGGTCIDLPVNFQCMCARGFTGTNCQTVDSEDSSSSEDGSLSSSDSLMGDSSSVGGASSS